MRKVAPGSSSCSSYLGEKAWPQLTPYSLSAQNPPILTLLPGALSDLFKVCSTEALASREVGNLRPPEDTYNHWEQTCF